MARPLTLIFVDVSGPGTGVWDTGWPIDAGCVTLLSGARLRLEGEAGLFEVVEHFPPRGVVLVRKVEVPF